MWSRAAAFSLCSSSLWACERPRATPATEAPTVAVSVASASATAPLSSSPTSAPGSPTPAAGFRPHAYRNRGTLAATQNALCEKCHQDAARQHRGSGHQRATVNPAFRAALAIEPTPFCRGCHAPEADPRHETPAALRELGVACVTCHTDDAGNVHAAPREGRPSEEVAGGHTILRSAAFAGPEACAGCHEFAFDSPGDDSDEHHMQTTVREHARGPFADTSCATCHMPTDDRGAHDHWFRGVRDPSFLRDSLRANVEALDQPGVRLTLTQALPGHAFPTGDLFRRLEVGVAIVDARGRIVARQVRHLARHLVIAPGTSGRKLVADDRVFAEPRVIDLVVEPPEPPPGKPGAPLTLRWWVTYQRPATVGDGVDPRHAKIESSVPLHGGTLAWPPSSQSAPSTRR